VTKKYLHAVILARLFYVLEHHQIHFKLVGIYHSVSDIELDLYRKSRIKDKKERQELQKKRKVIDERLQSLRTSRTVEYVS
jgi:hypothetical protein